MKVRLSIILIVLFSIVFGLSGCSVSNLISYSPIARTALIAVPVNDEDVCRLYPGRSFEDITPGEQRPFTLLVYVRGGEIEVEKGLATNDLKEMAAAAVNKENMSIVVMTGSTEKWQNKAIEGGKTNVYEMEGGRMKKVATMDNSSMAKPQTLSTFINFATTAYPADDYGLIIWGQGGSPAQGIIYDKIDGNTLMLGPRELKEALSQSNFSRNYAKFILLDGSFVSSIENAMAIRNYAYYMIGSEGYQPSHGYCYNWLSEFSRNTGYKISDIERMLVKNTVEMIAGIETDTTIAAYDMSKIERIEKAIEKLSEVIYNDTQENFEKIGRYVGRTTKSATFGEYGLNGSMDMVDLQSYASHMVYYYPKEAAELINSIQDARVDSYHTDLVNEACGLSIYCPTYKIRKGRYTESFVNRYEHLGFLPYHTKLIKEIRHSLNTHTYSLSEGIDVEDSIENGNRTYSIQMGNSEVSPTYNVSFNLWQESENEPGVWVNVIHYNDYYRANSGSINYIFNEYCTTYKGEFVNLNKREQEFPMNGITTYTMPVSLNGKDVTLIVRHDNRTNKKKISYGVTLLDVDGMILPSRDTVFLKKGDILKPYYMGIDKYMYKTLTREIIEKMHLVLGNTIRVDDEREIKDTKIPAGKYIGQFMISDVLGKDYFPKVLRLKF